jgi:hypothetical protein
VVLLGCGLRKLQHKAPAWELYQGPLYRCALAYTRELRVPWFILSALHGVVEGGTELAPYNRRVEDLPAPVRRVWGRDVVTRLARVLVRGTKLPRRWADGPRVVALAGRAYVEPWRALAEAEGWHVVEPLARLHPTGRRMQWLNVRPAQAPEEAAHGS